MRILLKLAVFGLVVHAGLQAGNSAWRFISFKDGVEQEALFAGERTAEEIRARVLERAAALEVPIEPQDVAVEFDGELTLISAVYVEEIPLVPRLYSYPMTYDASSRSVRLRRPLDRLDGVVASPDRRTPQP